MLAPRDPEQALTTAPFLLALALTEGSVEVRHFEEGYYAPGDRGADAEGAGAGGERAGAPAGWPGMPTAVVEVDLHSGARLRMKQGLQRRPRRVPAHGQGAGREAAPHGRGAAPKAQTDALFQSLRTLEQQRDIRDVLALTIAPKGKR